MKRSPRADTGSRVELLLGALVVAIAAAALAGWILDVRALRSVVTGGVGMKANTAVAFLLSGASAMLSARDLGRNGQRIVWTLGAVVALIGGLSMAQQALMVDFGIDELLFADPGGSGRISRPGRMSPAAAFCFLLAASAAVVASPSGRRGVRLPLSAALSAAVGLISTFVLAGHVSHQIFGLRWGMNATMAVNTALSFLALGIGGLLRARRLQGSPWALGRAGTAGFLLGLVLMLGASELAAGFARDMEADTTSVVRAQKALQDLQEIRTDMRVMESAQRGHLILGDGHFLEARETARASVRARVAALRDPPLPDALPSGQLQLRALHEAIEARIAFGDRLVVVRRTEGFESARAAFNVGEDVALTARVTNAIVPMMTLEREALALRQAHLKVATATTFLLLPVGTFLGLSVLCAVLFYLEHGFEVRHRAERDLKQSRADLAVVFESMSDGIRVIDEDGNLVEINPAGATFHGLIDPSPTLDAMAVEVEMTSPAGELIAADRWPGRRALRGDYVRNFEVCVRRRGSGKTIELEINTAPLHGQPGDPHRVLLTTHDVTERKAAEAATRASRTAAELQMQQLNAQLEGRVVQRTAELQAKTRALESFCYSVSHDLKAPLRAIDGYSGLLFDASEGRLDPDAMHFIACVRAATAQMNILIDDLLAYSRQELRTLVPSSLSLSALVRQNLALRTDALAGVRVEVQVEDVVVQADRESVEMALRNLIDNALKFSSHAVHPTIAITSRIVGSTCVLSVKDNGCGFDMKDHDRIFEIFQRLQRTEDYPGTGIGLALVRKSMERIGGSVRAESTPGEGATFHLAFELASARA